MQMLNWKGWMYSLAVVIAVAGLQPAAAGDRGVLYTVSQGGELKGYLLGTVHSDDARVLNFSEPFLEALVSCDRFAMELVPNQPTLSRLMDYMQYQDGTTLASRIGEARYRRVLNAAQSYNLGPDQLSRMKVWAAMMTLSIPPPESGLFMDLSLAMQASAHGLEVVGLETLDEQLSFLENMPEEHQLLLLDQALDDFDRLNEFFEQLLQAYLSLDLAALQAQSDNQFEELPPDVANYFYSQGIDQRNLRMHDRLLTQLQSGRVFAAVGALHLPGEKGLIALLRNDGYAVVPAEFQPFVEAP